MPFLKKHFFHYSLKEKKLKRRIMLIVSNVNFINQGKKLLNGISFTLDRERKVIICDNGSGKTTLLEIIAGNLPADSGDVKMYGKLAYVPQEIKNISLTALEEIETAFSNLKEIEKDFERLEESGHFGDEYAALIEEYTELGGYNYEHKIYELLNEFGLEKETLEKKIYELSGGERTKCEIIKAILTEPDILMIDEPTNHLDIETIETLEKTLLKFNGGVLIVSHDITFINRIATHILHLEDGVTKEYTGNYDKF
jgi:ATP-binding cassette subfamily F protein 3